MKMTINVTVTALHPESLVALPLLMELPGKGWLAITEADIDNYAGMYLTRARPNNSRILEAACAACGRTGNRGLAATPAQSPWRVIMIGDAPGRLIESNIVDQSESAVDDRGHVVDQARERRRGTGGRARCRGRQISSPA